jgi:AmmeMemoRadiSam system protein B
MSAHQFHKVRPPAFAGTFYPADPVELRQLVEFCLAGAIRCQKQGSAKAFVLPHAGYVYSGPIAGTGYHCLEEDRDHVRRIVLLGPSHRVAFSGVAVSSANSFATPLGEISVDESAVSDILELPQVQLLESAHEREHSLEVHLPFLQVVLGQFKLVPLVVGDATAQEVCEVLDRVWGGAETRILISSDLSHYHDYATARRLDEQTAATIGRLESVATDQACGASPLNGLLYAARKHGLHSHLLDLRSSGDTAGDRSRVVGYGAFAFGPR